MNFHAAVKDALKIVPFDDLKYAMFKAEHTNMIAKAQARLGRTVDPAIVIRLPQRQMDRLQGLRGSSCRQSSRP